MLRRHFGAAALVLLCSSPVLAEEQPYNPDPWEGFNRKVFAFNDKVDRYFLKPVAKGYRTITPQFVDDGVTNLLNNLGEPMTILSDVLQGKFLQSAQDTGRFIVNSTVGVVGLIDVARHIKLPRHEEDLGQTLAVWGVPSGPYVVVPFMFGMTIRDGAGFGAESLLMSELTENALDMDWREQTALLALGIIDTRADLIPAEEAMSTAGDRYILVRDALLQRRDFLIRDGVIEDDPFLDDDASFEEEPAAEVPQPAAAPEEPPVPGGDTPAAPADPDQPQDDEGTTIATSPVGIPAGEEF